MKNEQLNRKNSKKGIWIGVNDNNDIKTGPGIMLDGTNLFLDDLAHDILNEYVKAEELM